MRELSVGQELSNVNPRGRSQVTPDEKRFNGRRSSTVGRMGLQNAEAGVGITECSGHENMVPDFSVASGQRTIHSCRSHDGQAEKDLRRRGGGVAADQFDVEGATGRLDSSIEFTDVSRWNPDGKGHRDEQVQRGAPHGRDITEVGHPRAPAEVLRGLVVQVEMDALNQDVGTDQKLLPRRCLQHGGVVANAGDNSRRGRGPLALQLSDEPEFSDGLQGITRG